MLHIFFMLWFFHVALCSFFNFSPPVDPFSCCTTFILHIFMLHIFFMLHFQQFPLFIPHFLTLSLISWCAFCHAAFSSCCLPVATFSCDTFWCYTFFMSHFLSLFSCRCLHYVSFSCLYSFHAKLFSYFTFFCCIFSCCFLPYYTFSCLKSFQFGLFHILALFLCFHSLDVTLILRNTF